jgi:predicted  nucleic acid-binding Zn-ribbon protein
MFDFGANIAQIVMGGIQDIQSAARDQARLELEKKELKIKEVGEYNTTVGKIHGLDLDIETAQGKIDQAGITVENANTEINSYQAWLDDYQNYYGQQVGGLQTNINKFRSDTEGALETLNGNISTLNSDTAGALEKLNQNIGTLEYQTGAALDEWNSGIRHITEQAKGVLDTYNAQVGDLQSATAGQLESLNVQITEAEFEGKQTFRQLSDTLGYAEALAGATGRQGGSTSAGAVSARARNDIIAYAGTEMSLASPGGVYGARMNFLKNSVMRLVGEDMVMGGAEGEYERAMRSLRTSASDLIGDAMDLNNLGGSLGADVGDVQKKIAGLVGEDMVMGGAEGEFERQLAGYRNDIIRMVGEDMVMGGAEGEYERQLARTRNDIIRMVGDDMVMGGKAGGTYEGQMAQFDKDMQQLITNIEGEKARNEGQLGVWKTTLGNAQKTITTETDTIANLEKQKSGYIQQLKDMYPDLYDRYGLFDAEIEELPEDRSIPYNYTNSAATAVWSFKNVLGG